MPKVNLHKYITSDRIKSNAGGIVLQTLRKKYRWKMRDIAYTLNLEYKDVVSYFTNSYNRMTLEEFDMVCSMMPDTSPEDILKMIVLSSKNYGFISNLISKLDNVSSIKEVYQTTDREKELQDMLDKIIYAENYDDKMKAIEQAYRNENKISFDF